MQKAIEIISLTKIYHQNSARQKIALQDLALNVPKGSIFGLLGPNGAGKSTLISILAGTVVKTAGSVRVMDRSIDEYPKFVKSQIGVVPQEIVLDSFFSLFSALEFTAGYYGVRKNLRRTAEILKNLSLWDKKDALPRQLSGGMKRRFLIAKAMAHNPPILILDEPSAGVDLTLRDQLWTYLKKLKAAGVTIIITTHYLAEAQELCDEIAFINHGKIIKQDSTKNLLNLEAKHFDVEFAVDHDNILAPMVSGKAALEFELIANNKLRIYLKPDQSYNELLSEIQKLNLPIKNIDSAPTDLEDIFKKIIV